MDTNLSDARELREEWQAFARGVGDRRAELTLPMVYSSPLLAADGDAGAYLEHAIEDQRAALEIDDLELQTNAHAFLGTALFYAAKFKEAICLAEEDESRELICYLEVIAGEAHYLAHAADLGLAVARRVEDITRTLGEPPNMAGYAAVAFSYAHLMAERALDPIAAPHAHWRRRSSNGAPNWRHRSATRKPANNCYARLSRAMRRSVRLSTRSGWLHGMAPITPLRHMASFDPAALACDSRQRWCERDAIFWGQE